MLNLGIHCFKITVVAVIFVFFNSCGSPEKYNCDCGKKAVDASIDSLCDLINTRLKEANIDVSFSVTIAEKLKLDRGKFILETEIKNIDYSHIVYNHWNPNKTSISINMVSDEPSVDARKKSGELLVADRYTSLNFSVNSKYTFESIKEPICMLLCRLREIDGNE
ncbi:MAG: hypothetical protein K9H13_08305 [Bacteroidales bacterium]|nr:hypothetical protein [Bacteroidales bacterium]